ncbi:hypothetical protein RRG08_010544 [Elysia crispata]|uniref:Uncharacterized protein n=1 Tax=Elysia crispata TaxID=231223 RepID=A0AAE1AX07_9GAST|nr:hypothetical protein RRG08_010544 [Elysia crispata]
MLEMLIQLSLSNSTSKPGIEDTVDKGMLEMLIQLTCLSSITSQHEDTVDKNVGDVNSADLSNSITSQHEDNADKVFEIKTS